MPLVKFLGILARASFLKVSAIKKIYRYRFFDKDRFVPHSEFLSPVINVQRLGQLPGHNVLFWCQNIVHAIRT
jgi:hypothetical protein